MKSLALITLAAGALMFSTGCAKHYTLDNDFGATSAYSSTERYQKAYRAWDIDGRQFMDDVDAFLLTDQPSHLTRWHVQ